MDSELMIGPSTGWLYAMNIFSLARQKEILTKAGANVLEINIGIDIDKRMASLKKARFKDFAHSFLHFPDLKDRKVKQLVAIAKKAKIYYDFSVALIHPLKLVASYPEDDYKRIISNNIPLAIENMDSRKDSGFKLKELKKLLKITNLFVLDVQHAYEHDHQMIYAKDLLQSFQKELVYLHVSGETSNNMHSLVHKSENAKTIIEFIGKVLCSKPVPLILEGEYRNSQELKTEIEFLFKELKTA